MNRQTLSLLAGIVVGLALLLFVFERTGQLVEDRLLPAGFAAHANDIRSVTFHVPDSADGITLRRNDDGTWVVASRFDYPADVNKLGAFVTDLANARIVGEKTSNPDNYPRLAVDDPDAGGAGTKVILAGDGFSYEVILGNSARGGDRYVRIPSAATSYLVDRKLETPAAADDWLEKDLLDIPVTRVRTVTISHADGETIVIEKAHEDDGNFSVLDVPEGRELSYGGVGNDVAGALANLDFEAVRKAVGSDVTATTTVFETWDGLSVEIRIGAEGEAGWLAFTLQGTDADKLGKRLAGWQYRIADYRTNLLQQRWDDLLKTAL